MKSRFKFGRGRSYYKGFMEWECHGRIWQLQMWKGQPERRGWRAECSTCGEVGLSYSQLIKQKEEVNMVVKKEDEKGASLRPSSFVEGGGLLGSNEPITVVWHNSKMMSWKYPSGSYSDFIPVFHVELELEDGTTSTSDVWSAGFMDQWKESKDGERLIPKTKNLTIVKSSNLAILWNSLEENKWPEDKWPEIVPSEDFDLSMFDGLKCVMVRQPAPERKGLQKKEKKYDDSILVVDSIITFPWEAKGTGSGGRAKDAGSDAVTDKATEVVMEVLGDNPKGIQKMKLAGEVFKRLKAQKMPQTEINALVQLVGGKDESFLSSGPWTFEKGVVSQ